MMLILFIIDHANTYRSGFMPVPVIFDRKCVLQTASECGYRLPDIIAIWPCADDNALLHETIDTYYRLYER